MSAIQARLVSGVKQIEFLPLVGDLTALSVVAVSAWRSYHGGSLQGVEGASNSLINEA
jgi:hypothetical protein